MATLQEQLDIIQAAIDGKEIEFYESITKQWKIKNTSINREFDFICIKYRIKPEVDRYYQYVVKTPDRISPCRVFITIELFKSKADCQKEYEGHIVLKRLDHTKVEI